MYIYICIYTYIYVQMNVYVHIYIYMCTHEQVRNNFLDIGTSKIGRSIFGGSKFSKGAGFVFNILPHQSVSRVNACNHHSLKRYM